jgi:hypothetical protein
MKKQPAPTPTEAVLRGHLVVTVPVLTIILLATLIAYALPLSTSGPNGSGALFWLRIFRVPVGAIAGCMLGWIWWSASVPRWREWTKASGADEEKTQSLAAKTLLVWPKGTSFEKTEFRTPKPR